MRAGVEAPVMIGRAAELSVMRGLLTEAAAGRGSRLLIHGTAGVGKSALLRTVHAEAAERGFTVLSTAGAETEQWFPFAALHLLLQPVAKHVGDLPPAYQLALRGAFGAAESQPDAYRVGLAVLELLADAADRQPVLVLADDLQWFDAASREVLSFVGRRARDHALQVFCAARTDGPDWRNTARHPELHLEPLDRAAAAALLDAGAPDLPAAVRALILDRAAGNPLALVALPKAAHSAPDGVDGLPLTQRLEGAFGARTTAVSPACRTFLLVMAAESTASLDRLLEVTARLTRSAVSVAVLQEAVDARLVSLREERPEFRHPLMRSAIYKRATVADRLAVHRALAAVLEDAPERQLTHLVAATLGPDEDLADRLQRFAGDAQARGTVAAAVTALRRAAGLIGDARRRTRVLIRAAELSSQLSDRDQTRELLARADLSGLGPVERARLLLVSDNAAFEPDEPARRICDMVTAAAGAFDDGAREVAESLLWRAAARCFFQDADARTRAGAAAELDRWQPDPDDPHALTVRAYTVPYRYGADVLARLDNAIPDRPDGQVLHFLGSGAMVLGDFTRSTRCLSRAAAVWRTQGRLGLLARSLAGAWPRIYLGQLEQARAEADEGCVLARETGESIALPGLIATAGLVAVLRGETETAADSVRELRADLLFPGLPFAGVIAQQIDGLLALFDGRAAEAYDILARVFDPADPHHHSVSRWLAEVARSQLRAAGESTGGRLPHLGEQLSAQELQIALLAARGLTNREIAQRLFISHRTVGSHLYHIYPRLGVTGRGQLAAALAAGGEAPDPA